MTEKSLLFSLPRSKPINISFENIAFSVPCVGKGKGRRQILKGISGEFRCGELTAIMGPSGAGKSTFLNILTGFQTGGMQGCIYKNGISRDLPEGNYRKESCYIMQDDQLCPFFTVIEIMTMAAHLKLGISSFSDKSKMILIDDILDSLGLSLTKSVRCDSLSGGQKKRLSVALELIGNPSVLFLDEPSSGLDSSSSAQCIGVLKALAREGRTIICTIHQPSASVYEMFDHVYIIAEGFCLYQGSSKNTVNYLSAAGLPCPQYHNPADFLAEVAAGDYGDYIQLLSQMGKDSRWRGMSLPTKYEENQSRNQVDSMPIFPPSEFAKLWVLINRNIIQLYRDWTTTHLKLILHCLVGILLGLNFTGVGEDGSKTLHNIGFIFCTIIYLSYTSMMPAILKFPLEMSVMKKEKFNNWYNLRTYYIALLTTNTPVQLSYCGVYVTVSYYLSDQPWDITRFILFTIICMLVVLTAESLGLYLGTLDSIISGLFFGSLFTAYLLVYSGCLQLFSQMTKYLYWPSFFSWGRYAFSGLVLSVYGFNRPPLFCPDHYCHLKVPAKVMKEIGVEEGHYWIDVAALIVMLLFFRTIAFLSLQRKVSCKS